MIGQQWTFNTIWLDAVMAWHMWRSRRWNQVWNFQAIWQQRLLGRRTFMMRATVWIRSLFLAWIMKCAATSVLQFGKKSGSNLVTEDCCNGSSVTHPQLVAILQQMIRTKILPTERMPIQEHWREHLTIQHFERRVLDNSDRILFRSWLSQLVDGRVWGRMTLIIKHNGNRMDEYRTGTLIFNWASRMCIVLANYAMMGHANMFWKKPLVSPTSGYAETLHQTLQLHLAMKPVSFWQSRFSGLCLMWNGQRGCRRLRSSTGFSLLLFDWTEELMRETLDEFSKSLLWKVQTTIDLMER